MNEIDDLLGTNDNSNNNMQYNKNNWKEQGKKRNEAYKKIEDMSFKIVKEDGIFIKYLNILSKFEKYSIANCLLILCADENAIQIKEKQEWIDRGYNINENAKSITILEPNRVNEKLYYNPKEEYDISQTNATIPEEKSYTDREILSALFNNLGAEKEVVDILPNGNKGAEYIASENKLYMCRGLKPEYLLKAIIQEVARMEMQDMENNEMKEFKTYCISYMISKRYGLNISQFDFSNLPSDLENKGNSKEIRNELEDVRKNFTKINSKIAEYFEQTEKEKKNKEQER